MKKLLFLVFLAVLFVSLTSTVEAKKGAYYKDAGTGRFTTKKSYYKSPSTTYRSYRK